MVQTLYFLWLMNAVTSASARKLIKLYDNVHNIYNCTDFSEADFLKPDAVQKLCSKNMDKAIEIYNTCKNLDIQILTYDSPEYPPQLLKISDYPPVIYAKGIIPAWKTLSFAGVVGTRKVSVAGSVLTEDVTRQLINEGKTIVSGFAAGVDTIAAKTAVSLKSFTVAVLGNGVDIIFPATNSALYSKVQENGVFISEYPPGTRATKFTFPQRNRLIAALCESVTITEAPPKSGAMITANHAKKYGKTVYILPLKKQSFPEVKPKRSTEKKAPAQECDNEILTALAERDLNIDELCSKLNYTMSECNSKCFMLELEGKIKRLPGGFYHRF